jgi:peptidoglycan-N-acetylglucosamine deacetylase
MRIYRFPKFMQRLFPNILWDFPKKKDTIFLTFDDGPHEIYTHQILDIMEEHNAKATFFLLGEKLKTNKELVIRMRDSGHTLGIHGYNHDSMLSKSKKIIREQLERTKDELETLTRERVQLFRPPYGLFNRAVQKECRQLSLRLVMWNFLTYDFDIRLSDSYLLKIFQKKLRASDIVTLHDGHRNSERTVRLLPKFIQYITEQELNLSVIEK